MTVFDISYWQSEDTIQKIKRLGADGVILRLGITRYGIPQLDEKYIHFVNEAVKENIPHGLYYYSKMTNQSLALAEAQFINDKVYELLNGNEPPLGVWFDMEDKTTMWNGMYTALINTIDTMHQWGFKKVGIYSGYYFYKEWMNLKDLEQKQIPIWVAQYYKNNNLRKEYPNLNWHGWQFTDKYDGQTLDGNEWYKF